MEFPIRANNNPKFYRRFLYMGLGALAFMLYCLYDGAISYPSQQVRGEALMELSDGLVSDEDIEKLSAIPEEVHGEAAHYLLLAKLYAKGSNEAFNAAWEAEAEANGWPTEPPAKLRTVNDILQQYLMAILTFIAGAWMLITVWRSNGRWIEATESGVETSWGESMPYDAVTEIVKKQWRDKGIAKVKYQASGRRRTFVVDDYKYDRGATDRILYVIEQRAGQDKISGGPPELDPDAPVAQEAQPEELVQPAEQETSTANDGG
ncbi:hypothetical protein Mal64_05420 [Pseudobythopirellula maris]|uniref:Uncharacterized protein n=1 Tax=Pseudobythopirellula maris TaxID=2527991 RepID=A0A5C5ZSX0_9BACT|nr:hypothetical protein [Pseudobythopirellula maris]TWT90158.1 hypothetical protein Mal64_05420 [Pseudobythopirellula maris]